MSCARVKDPIGLRFDFTCKLVHLLKDFDVFEYIKKVNAPEVKIIKSVAEEEEENNAEDQAEGGVKKEKEESRPEPPKIKQLTPAQQGELNARELNKILSDARFKRDSYYIVSLGKVGPLLVDWVRALVAYMAVAKTMVSIRKHADEERIVAARMKVF